MVNLNVLPSFENVSVLRKSILMLGKNAVNIAKEVKVSPNNVAKIVATNGIAPRGTLFR